MSRSLERRARKIALWLLYAIEMSGGEPAEALAHCRESMDDVIKSKPELWERVVASVNGVSANLTEINAKVQAVSPKWKLSRMAAIDRNILRIGAWEILVEGSSPLPVINNCVDLGKEYGEKSTSGFINGLLDEICKTNGIKLK